MGYVLMVLLGYLLGSSNMTWYLAKLKKVDLTSRGSGNLGTSNATIVLGWKAGILTGIHDIGKGILAVILARLLFPGLEYIGAAAGAACVCGHIFPFYLHFRGGKGFAAFLGMTLGLNWKLALAVMAAVLIIVPIPIIVLLPFSYTLYLYSFPVLLFCTSLSILSSHALCRHYFGILAQHFFDNPHFQPLSMLKMTNHIIKVLKSMGLAIRRFRKIPKHQGIPHFIAFVIASLFSDDANILCNIFAI